MPFLHITTRIPDHPYDKLMSEKGGTGFPTLMFLDDQGRKLLKHTGARTTEGFSASLENAAEFLSQIRKFESGDRRLAAPVFIRQLENGWFGYDEAVKRYEELGKLKSKDRKRIKALLVDTEVRTMVADAGKDERKRLAAGAHFVEMWKDKRTPSTAQVAYPFWALIADHAEAKGDKRLFKRAIAGFEDSPAGKSPRYRRFGESLKKRLKKL